MYKVRTFVPTVKGCGAKDNGWDEAKCKDFEEFINSEAVEGFRLHSYEYREVSVASGCANTNGVWLVCIFEK